MTEDHFAATAERLKATQKSARKTRYYSSRLDPHRTELFALASHGCTIAQLHRRLRELRVKVAPSTVYRWAAKNKLKLIKE